MHAKTKSILKILSICFIVCVILFGAVWLTIYLLKKEHNVFDKINSQVVNIENFHDKDKNGLFDYTNLKTGSLTENNPFYLIYYSELNNPTNAYMNDVKNFSIVNKINQVKYDWLITYFIGHNFTGNEQKLIKNALKNYNSSLENLKNTADKLSKNLTDINAKNVFYSQFLPSYLNYINNFDALVTAMQNTLIDKNIKLDNFILQDNSVYDVAFYLTRNYYLQSIINAKTKYVKPLLTNLYGYTQKYYTSLINNIYYNGGKDIITDSQAEAFAATFKTYTNAFDEFKASASKLTTADLDKFYASNDTVLDEVATTDPSYHYVKFNNYLVANGQFDKLFSDPALLL